MKDIEIPHPEERKGLYRWLERLPLMLSASVLLIPIALTFISTFLAGLFVVTFVITWFIRTGVTMMRVTQGFRRMQKAMRLDWRLLLNDVDNAEKVLNSDHKHSSRIAKDHYKNLEEYLISPQTKLKSKDVIHAVVVAVYKESYDVVEPTIRAVVDSNINTKKQAILIFAYEERAGQRTKEVVEQLISEYGDAFMYAEAIAHPDGLPGEVRGKGGNITFAARKFSKWLRKNDIDPARVLLTTLDADNRPHPSYFAAASYAFLTNDNRKLKSYQPVIIYTNNVWDVPAPSRVIAMSNSFFTVTQSLRPHMLRNFSSHAQPMDAIEESDYWSVRTIVEDGHQFWRSYFAFDGHYDVVPIFVPIYQDAVLSEGYVKTLKAQFIQLRRWAWGCSDVAYVATKAFFTPNKVPKLDAFTKLVRLIDTHVSWATAALLIAFAAWAPILLSPDGSEDILAQQLPGFISRISLVSTVGILLALYLTFRFIPARPPHKRKVNYLFLVLQWALIPVISLSYVSFSALYSQTRLFLGKYMGFDLTIKAVKKDGKKAKI